MAGSLLTPATADEISSSSFPGRGKYEDWKSGAMIANEGRRCLVERDYGKAIEKYQQAISIYSFDNDWYNNLGIALKRCGDMEGAMRAYETASKLNPGHWGVWSNIGITRFAMGQPKQSIDSFEEALKHNPPEVERSKIETSIQRIRAKFCLDTPGQM